MANISLLSAFYLLGFQINALPVSSGTTTLNGKQNFVRADATSGNVIINLPATGGQPITIKRIDATANTITVSGNGINIDGTASVTIKNQNDSFSFWYDTASNTYNVA